MGSKKERKLKAQAKKTTQNSSAVGTEKQPVEKKAKKLEQKLQITTASRPLWTIVIIVVGVMLLEFLFQFMLNTVVTDQYMKAHPELTETAAIRDAVAQYMEQNPIFFVLRRIIYNLSGILALMLLFGRVEKEQLPEIGFSNPRFRGGNIIIGVVISALAVFCAYALLTVLEYIEPTGAFVFSWLQPLWVVNFVLMSFFEEMFFHGYLVFKLGKLKPVWIVLITSVVFALWGGLPSTNPIIYLNYLILGAFLCFTRIKFDSLWFGIAFRFGWTLTSGVFLSIYTNPNLCPGILEHSGLATNFLAGNQAGFENGMIATIILSMCFIVVYKISQSRQTRFQRRLTKDGYIR